jgi:hypothetical protein
MKLEKKLLELHAEYKNEELENKIKNEKIGEQKKSIENNNTNDEKNKNEGDIFTKLIFVPFLIGI